MQTEKLQHSMLKKVHPIPITNMTLPGVTIPISVYHMQKNWFLCKSYVKEEKDKEKMLLTNEVMDDT